MTNIIHFWLLIDTRTLMFFCIRGDVFLLLSPPECEKPHYSVPGLAWRVGMVGPDI